MIANAKALTISGIVSVGRLSIRRKPSITPRNVASSPGPSPPRPAVANTAGTKNRKGESSCSIGVSATRTAKAMAAAMIAIE
jgi:hypothetical protein